MTSSAPSIRNEVWVPDVLAGYQQRTLALGPDPDGEGELFATLVRHGKPLPAAAHAVLVVHGYTDYFFNTELGDFFAARGIAFYAIDLHKCGRSWREGQTPHFTTHLAGYDVELESAMAIIAAETGHAKVLVLGHSAGGLIVSLWLDRLRRRGATASLGVTGLVLNSPFFDLRGPWILRSLVASSALLVMSALRGKLVVRGRGGGGYGRGLHRDFDGEWEYSLQWKPIGGFPVTFAWIHAIRRGHARLHRGLDVGVPNLVLRSDRTIPETKNPSAMHHGDAVLDVGQIARWAGCLGNRTTVVPIPDAKHDVFLSLPTPRQRAYRELSTWLDTYFALVDPSRADWRRAP